jgi:hypothetical protein
MGQVEIWCRLVRVPSVLVCFAHLVSVDPLEVVDDSRIEDSFVVLQAGRRAEEHPRNPRSYSRFRPHGFA